MYAWKKTSCTCLLPVVHFNTIYYVSGGGCGGVYMYVRATIHELNVQLRLQKLISPSEAFSYESTILDTQKTEKYTNLYISLVLRKVLKFVINESKKRNK